MPRSSLADRLDYHFRDSSLFAQALTHRSYGAQHNERLEFIGDAVLNCVVAAALYRRLPTLSEGDLSRLRANLVNRDSLASQARALDLGSALRLGDGERRGAAEVRPSIIADALEAVLGAIFLDGGYAAAATVIEQIYAELLDAADPKVQGKDPKTRLQEWLQARRLPVPDYSVTLISGEAHAQLFTVACRVAALDLEATAQGTSRRAAEQAAAGLACERLAQLDQAARDG
jgi:ribonuclease-3